jgi:Sec-independent protein translocase protein TatA
MSSKRLHLILMAVIVLLLVGLVGGTYELNALLTKKGNSLTGLKAQTQALDQEQVGLKKAKKEIATYADLQKVTKTIVPEDKSQAEAVRELVKIAADNGVSLSSITFPVSTLGNTTVKPGSSTASPSAPAPAPAANAKSATNALSQLLPVKNIPGVYLLQITIQNDDNHPVSYSNFINFLDGLEHNRRTAQVSTVNIQPNAKNPNLLTFVLTLNEYIKP